MADVAPTEPTKPNRWEIVGKVSLLFGIIVAGITIYNFYFPSSPRLVALVFESKDLLPNNAIDNVKGTVNKHYANSLRERVKQTIPDSKLFDNLDPALVALLDKYSEERVNENKIAFQSVEQIKQKISVVVFNNGSRTAEAVNVVLPMAISGVYQIDNSRENPKPFERTIPVGDVRPDAMVFIDIWIYTNTISKDKVTADSPDGPIRMITQQFVPDKTFWEEFAPPLLLIENLLFIILILVAVISEKFIKKTDEIAETSMPSEKDKIESES